MRRALYGAALFVVATFTAAMAQGGSPIRIGNDQSGVFADLAGPGSVTAAQMAAEDFGGQRVGPDQLDQASGGVRLVGGQRPVSLQSFISDIHSLGLEKAQGLLLIAAFYWDLDDQTRAWSQRFAQRNGGRMPTMVQAGVYSAVSHYLKALKEAGTDDATTVASQMRQMRVNDFMTHNAQIRNDGWVMRDFYLFQVK